MKKPSKVMLRKLAKTPPDLIPDEMKVPDKDEEEDEDDLLVADAVPMI